MCFGPRVVVFAGVFAPHSFANGLIEKKRLSHCNRDHVGTKATNWPTTTYKSHTLAFVDARWYTTPYIALSHSDICKINTSDTF